MCVCRCGGPSIGCEMSSRLGQGKLGTMCMARGPVHCLGLQLSQSAARHSSNTTHHPPTCTSSAAAASTAAWLPPCVAPCRAAACASFHGRKVNSVASTTRCSCRAGGSASFRFQWYLQEVSMRHRE